MRGQTPSTLLRAPVLTRGIRLGEVETVLLDAEEPRILGLEVHCGDGANRFLPFSTARRGAHGIEIDSTFTLLDSRELEFYRAHGRPLTSVPELAEARIEPDGALVIPLSAHR
ncbi:MAG TPA: PRC-barrel domain-containing protein [Gaiellaceae bacterium]|nr:PRC-barrel domain-containing protein [Gaiellaceae bacterium]